MRRPAPGRGRALARRARPQPLERVDREGVTSWDLVLDGRRRFDLPDHADPRSRRSALICWVHFAPPIGDSFRKSYRRCCAGTTSSRSPSSRWPRTSGRSSPPSCRSRTLDRDELGLALARILAISDQLLDESAGWLWLGGTDPASTAGRVSRGAAPRSLRYADRLPELLEPPRGRRRRAVARGAAEPAAAVARCLAASCGRGPRGCRRAARLAGRRRPSRPRPPPRDLTLTSPTRATTSIPTKQRVHVTVDADGDQPPRRDTKTRRYYFDRAYLAVQPGTTDFKISAGDRRPAVQRRQTKPDHTLLRIDFGQRLPAGTTRTLQLTFDLPDPGRRRRPATSGSGRRLVAFPVWAFASDRTPGGSVERRLPGGLRRRRRARQLGEPDDRRRRPDVSPRAHASPSRLTFFAYVVADRPGAYTETTRPRRGRRRGRSTSRSAPGPTIPVGPKRVGGLLERGLPALGDGDRAAVARRAAARRRRGGQPHDRPATPAASTPRPAGSRSPTTPIRSSSSTRPPTPGSTAGCWRIAGRTRHSRRSTPIAAATLDRRGDRGRRADRRAPAARVPLNAWRPVGLERAGRPRTTATPRRWSWPARSPSGRDRRACARVWRRRRGSGVRRRPTSRGDASTGEPGSARTHRPSRSGPPDWRGLLDLLEDRTGQTYDDLWRAWVVRRRRRAARRARRRGREYDAVIRRAGDWELPRVIRDAMRAWQFEQATELLAAADGRSTSGRRSRRRPRSPSSTPADARSRPRSRATAGSRPPPPRPTRSSPTIDAYDRAAGAAAADPDLVEQVGLWGTTPDIDLADARRPSRRATSAARREASDDGRGRLGGRRDVGRNRS